MYNAHVTARVWVLWALFLVRGAFFCAMLPLWEAWDEYAHFAWLEHWNTIGTLPRSTTPVSAEIEESLKLTPLTEELKWMGPGHYTYEQWWALPAAARAGKERHLAGLRGESRNEAAVTPLMLYQAQQPPLFYWLAAIPERLTARWPLRQRVVLVRLFSLLLASAVIPLAWLAARSVLDDTAATMCVTLLAIAPVLTLDAARVANDGLAIALTAVVLLILMRRGPGLALGIVLGAGLLTKAYLLTLLPAVILARRKNALAPVAIALAVAGWWYARNLLLGNSLSRWQDHAGSAAIAAAVTQVNWLAAANVLAKSFFWFGGWSFLTLKSWMYIVLEIIGAAGFALALRKRGLAAAWAMSGFQLLAIGYGVLIYYAVHRVGNLPGWYLWPMAAPLALLLGAGLARWTAALVLLLGVADIYGTTALMVPYYAGFVPRNRANGAQFLAGLGRLQVPLWLAAAWLVATLAVVAVSLRPGMRRSR